LESSDGVLDKINNGYGFEEVLACNMCGYDTAKSKVHGIRLDSSQGFNPRGKTGVAVTLIYCKRCGLIYASPLPVPFDIQQHYGIAPDEYWNPEYFSRDPLYFSEEIIKAKELLEFSPGMKALDIGAGLGKCMLALSDAGFDVDGFEPSVTFREKAISELGVDPSRLKLGMMEDIEYPPNSFDFITFGAVLEHLYNPDEAIRKALSWLKEGGVIQIEVPSSDWFIAKVVNSFYRAIGTIFVTNLSPMHEPYHLYEFSLNSFKKNADINNYEIAHYQYYVCRQPHIPQILQPLFRWYMAKFNKGMQLKVWLRKKIL